MVKNIMKLKGKTGGFTLVEIMVSLVITTFLTAAIYNFFISQNHAYSVEDQIIELQQNSRSTINIVRQELRMAGYNAMGPELVNNLSSWVPASFIPTSPLAVSLNANPKITDGGTTKSDMITFLSVLTSENNPTTFAASTAKDATTITLSLSASETDDQYNEGDIVHIGTCSEYAKITDIPDIPGNTLTIDTNPTTPTVNDGLDNAYIAGTPIGEISVVSYAVFTDENPPVLKRKVNGLAFYPVTDNITDMQILSIGSGEIEVSLSAKTDKRDSQFTENGGYRTIDTSTKIKLRNVNSNIAGGSTCPSPSAPSNLSLSWLNEPSIPPYPCTIHITWIAPTATTGCPTNGYRIYYSDQAGLYSNTVDVGNVTTYDLDLNNATFPPQLKACIYYVAVAAINSNGVGAKVESSITDLGRPPATPTGLTAVNQNGIARRVKLLWTANTDCDLQGYNIYRSTTSGTAGSANDTPLYAYTSVQKGYTEYYDNSFTCCYDCAKYYYVIKAADYCPNLSSSSVEVSAEPTKASAPTNGTFSANAGTDTITWKPSADDFVIESNGIYRNYITYYKIYYGTTTTLTQIHTVEPTANATTYSYSYNPTADSLPYGYDYAVSVLDQCGKESDKLIILAACTQIPEITNIVPASGATLSSTRTISGTVTAPAGRTISGVTIKLNNIIVSPVTFTGQTFSYTWNTTTYTNTNHDIKITATDNQGCSKDVAFTVAVNNDLNNCSDKPTISITLPASGATISGTQMISGYVTAVGDKKISSLKIKINDVEKYSTVYTSPGITASFYYNWDTLITNSTNPTYPNGNHTIKVVAVDSGGCITTNQITVNVSNASALNCKIYACKPSGNTDIDMVVYVYDQYNLPVLGATATSNILFGGGAGAYNIPGQSDGYYGGSGNPDCSSLSTEGGETITGTGKSIASKSNYQNAPTITITVTKSGYIQSQCTRY